MDSNESCTAPTTCPPAVSQGQESHTSWAPGIPQNKSTWNCETSIDKNLTALVGLYLSSEAAEERCSVFDHHKTSTAFLLHLHWLASALACPGPGSSQKQCLTRPNQPWRYLYFSPLLPTPSPPHLLGTWADLLPPLTLSGSFLSHFLLPPCSWTPSPFRCAFRLPDPEFYALRLFWPTSGFSWPNLSCCQVTIVAFKTAIRPKFETQKVTAFGGLQTP